MDDGIFDDRLQHQLRHHAAHQLLRDLDLEAEGVVEAQLLDIAVAFEQLELLLQRFELAPRDASAEDLREIRAECDDFRHLMGLRHPLDGVECVIEEVRIQLCLHHPHLGFVEMLLLLHPLFHVPADPNRRLIEAIGELPELVIPRKLHMGAQISMA